MTEKVLKKFKNLRIIATRSHGFTHIDLDYCIKNRINVLNIEQYGEEAVAEFALGVIIDLTRNIKSSMIDIRNNDITSDLVTQLKCITRNLCDTIINY